MAIILNFNPVLLKKRRKETSVSIEGRWILTDYKWVHTDRVDGSTGGGYMSFSPSDSEYHACFSQGFKCELYTPASAVFDDSDSAGGTMGKYSLNVNRNEITFKLEGQTVRFSVLCLTNDTLQLYWTNGDKKLTIEDFFIFTRDKSHKGNP